MSKKKTSLSRRAFLGRTAALAAVPYLVPASVFGRNGAVPPSERIILGGIGIGTRGSSVLNWMLPEKDVQFVATCDPQKQRREAVKKMVDTRYGNSDCQLYSDIREFLATRTDIDAGLSTTGGDDPGHDRLREAPGGFQRAFAGLGGRPLGVVVNEDRRAILRAAVTELPVLGEGIDIAPKNIQQLFVADSGRIIVDLHGFSVAGTASRNLFIGRVGGVATGIAGHGVPHARQFFEWRLHAPETAARECGDSFSGGRGNGRKRAGVERRDHEQHHQSRPDEEPASRPFAGNGDKPESFPGRWRGRAGVQFHDRSSGSASPSGTNSSASPLLQ